MLVGSVPDAWVSKNSVNLPGTTRLQTAVCVCAVGVGGHNDATAETCYCACHTNFWFAFSCTSYTIRSCTKNEFSTGQMPTE